FFSSRRRHTRFSRDWSSDVCSSDLSWCWPAHDDTFTVHGSVLATVDDPYLDLGAGEVVAQLAWIDHLLGAQLDARYPGIRARIQIGRASCRERGRGRAVAEASTRVD